MWFSSLKWGAHKSLCCRQQFPTRGDKGHAANEPGQSQSSLPSEWVSVTQDPLSYISRSQRERRLVALPRALEVLDFEVLRFA
jgi:hypothetical protein